MRADGDAFANAAERVRGAACGGADRRSDSADEERTAEADRVEGLAENARVKRFEVDRDVWEFWYYSRRLRSGRWKMRRPV